MKLCEFLQIGRAQTFPASWLLVLVPFLCGRIDLFQALILTVLMWFSHIICFAHNSLMDACTKPSIESTKSYDQLDKNKAHFPLITGSVSLHEAKLVFLWGLSILGVLFVVFAYLFAENFTFAMVCIYFYWVWGVVYNEGLSKESVFGFLPISICFTFLGLYGWFLSHQTLSYQGWLFLSYFFFTILWQISWSGFIKEIEVGERSNILRKMGAKIIQVDGKKIFSPRFACIYGFLIKPANLFIGLLLLLEKFTISTFIWYILVCLLAIVYMFKLIRKREYIRKKELFNMSIEEILTIYLPIPLLLNWATASLLMTTGFLYFFIVNKMVWKVPYPKV